MPWSWKIARVAGIDVYVHATFLILLGWIGWINWLDGRTATAVVEGIAFILVLFACVVFHEFGHALTARRYGIRTRDITLLPIGGLARLERMPDDPRQELWVALAGPAVNAVIAAVLFVVLQVTGAWTSVDALDVASGPFIERVLIANVVLVVFNLLPAFPMDGGRALRALLATRMDYVRATQIAATIGQGMAMLLGLLGIFGNPFLVFIALFVWIGAAQEASMVQMKSALAGIPVARAMLTHFRTLAPTDTLAHAADLLLADSQRDFPVVDGQRVLGMLTRQGLVDALRQREESTAVSMVMTHGCDAADASEMLDPVFARLQTQNCHSIPVMQRGALVGLLTMDNVGELMMLQAATRKGPRPS